MLPIKGSAVVFGAPTDALNLTVRKVLREKDFSGSLLVLDYSGRGAMVIGDGKRIGLMDRPVIWYDLADRRRPVALFQLRHSEYVRSIVLRTLHVACSAAEVRISDSTLFWAAEAAQNLSESGSIGLISLLKSFSSPEIRRRFMESQNEPADFALLIGLIKWLLRYPSVFNISEGPNRSELRKWIFKPSVVWIEAQREHFEWREHRLVVALAEAAVEDALRWGMKEREADTLPPAAVLHLYPSAESGSQVPQWIAETSKIARHIVLVRFHPDQPIDSLSLSWIRAASTMWVNALIRPMDQSSHSNWLHPRDIERINSLKPGQVWVKSNEHSQSLVVNVGSQNSEINLASRLRISSSKNRKEQRIHQIDSITPSVHRDGGETFGLYQMLCDKEALRMGWLKVHSGGTKDSHGVDNVTLSKFSQDLEKELSDLSFELRIKKYKCRPLRRVFLQKPDGGKRGIGIACIRDRVVMSACLLILEPIFEPTFSRYSFAFRPRRNAHQAIAMVRALIAAGSAWTVIADIKKCFDTVDHERLLYLLSRTIGDSDLLELMKHWLSAETFDFQGLLPTITGIVQGEPLSPLLANIYLSPLDRHFERLGFHFVRYADDIIILCSSEEEAKKALIEMEAFLKNSLYLSLKPSKTQYVPLREGFDFLGFTIKEEGIEISGKKIGSVQEILREYLKKLGRNEATIQTQLDSITKINALIRGFRNYFALPDEALIAQQLSFLDHQTDQMGEFHLSENLREDPAWLGRERFFLKKEVSRFEAEQEGISIRRGALAGYPGEESEPCLEPHEMGEDAIVTKSGTRISSEAYSGKEEAASDREEDNHTNLYWVLGDRLFVFAHGCYLTLSENDLLIRKAKREICRHPVNGIGLLFLQGFGMSVSVSLQLRLAELDIPVVFCPAVGQSIAVLNPATTSRSALRRRQILRREALDVVTTGLRVIAAKMTNQAAVLRYFSKYRKKIHPSIGRELTSSADDMRKMADTVLKLDPRNDAVRGTAIGFEGHCASTYWQNLSKILPLDLGFPGRVTKAAKDVVNQCLNYTYGILYGEVWRAVVKAGLDPYFGLIHESTRDQGSLVFDLIEEFRAPFVDRLVVAMLGRGFVPEIGKEGFLKTRTRRKLAISFSKKWAKEVIWRSKHLSPSEILERQARDLARLFSGEASYHPYRMRW